MNGTGRHQSLVVVGNLGEGDNTNFAKTDGHEFDSDGKQARTCRDRIDFICAIHYIPSCVSKKKERVLNL